MSSTTELKSASCQESSITPTSDRSLGALAVGVIVEIRARRPRRVVLVSRPRRPDVVAVRIVDGNGVVPIPPVLTLRDGLQDQAAFVGVVPGRRLDTLMV